MNLTSKGQVTIPKAIRDQFGLHAGTEIEFGVEGNRVFLSANKGRRDSLGKARGTANAGLSTEQILQLTRGDSE